MVNLTEGAVPMLCNGQVGDLKPVLQVSEIRLVNSQQQQSSSTERYRLVLSDGVYGQQGMLATQKNELVKNGKLNKGSIVRLTQFVCNVIQSRMIIIIIDLDLIVEQCDVIGHPVPYVNANSGSAPKSGSSTLVPSLDKPNAAADAPQQPRMDNAYGSSYSINSDAGRYAKSNPPTSYSKMESGAGTAGSVPYTGSYSNNNMGPYGSKTDVSRASSNIYGRSSQPAPMYMNKGPVSKNEAPPRVIPIAALNPYQGRWTIKARVTAKGELRHYNNPRGDGKVFSFDLLDSAGGEIRVTCFNAVADQFYSQIEIGRVYMISKGSLKPAQKTFNHLNNDHEIFLESTSMVQPCLEDDNEIPKQQFHFRPISDVEGMENNSVVDVIGVVSSISPSASIMRKNGTETQKRTLQLKDMSGRSVEITLWGNFCNAEGQTLQIMCDSGASPVLAVKSGRVSDFNGKAVGTISTSQLFIEPDFKEACGLREWFDKEGRITPSVSISRETSSAGRTDVRKTVSQIKDERLGTSEKPDWITVSANVSFIKIDNFCYTACPAMIGDRQCSKKVTNNGDGKWRCDRCDKSVDECDYRYILQFQIQDHTGITWVTAFQECGEEIMGISAKDLYYMKYEEQDDDRFGEIIRKVLFNKYLFKLKVKEETFSDEQRVKSTVIKAEKVNFSTEFRYLLSFMDKLKGEDSGSAPKAESFAPNAGQNTPLSGTARMRQPMPPGSNYTGNISSFGGESRTQTDQIGQYGNPYTGSTIPTSGPTSTYVSCSSCGGTGHSSTNCPSIIGQSIGGGYVNRVSPGPGSGSASGDCYKCHQSGHWARDCPGVVVSPAPNSGSASNECYKCHQSGHWARDCPGVSNVPPAYVGSGVTPGRYGGVSKQHVGGF